MKILHTQSVRGGSLHTTERQVSFLFLKENSFNSITGYFYLPSQKPRDPLQENQNSPRDRSRQATVSGLRARGWAALAHQGSRPPSTGLCSS